jgi:hypothetical protein
MESVRPRTVEELIRELGGSSIDVVDGLARLQAAGLVNSLAGCVFASRAAVRCARIGL